MYLNDVYGITVSTNDQLPLASAAYKIGINYAFKLCDLPKLWCGNAVPLKKVARHLPYQLDLLRHPCIHIQYSYSIIFSESKMLEE